MSAGWAFSGCGLLLLASWTPSIVVFGLCLVAGFACLIRSAYWWRET